MEDAPAIAAVDLSTTAFVGRARMGPVDTPVVVRTVEEYGRVFGGAWAESPMSFAVAQYFRNGGRAATIVRVDCGADGRRATAATWRLAGPAGALVIEASSPGSWADTTTVAVSHPGGLDRAGQPTFDLAVTGPDVGPEEELRGLSVDPASPAFVATVLAQRSLRLRVAAASGVPSAVPFEIAPTRPTPGGDGGEVRDADVVPSAGGRGLRALGSADAFGLLVVPPLAAGVDVAAQTYRDAAALLGETGQRATLIVDAPSAATDASAFEAFRSLLDLGDAGADAALFVPRLLAPNTLREGAVEAFAPSGAVAGVIARTDAERGTWTAPAGTEAVIEGAVGVSSELTSRDSEHLARGGVNALRTFTTSEPVIWGARTLVSPASPDALTWRFIPVRRTARMIEASVSAGLGWTGGEPNDERLWSRVQGCVGAFLHDLFRRGAFRGARPAEAYVVRCDRTTMTQDDLDGGFLTVVVGFAAVRPAEFVTLRIRVRTSPSP